MNNNSSVKRSLVLAGGGVRLAYHAGVLIALEEAGIHFSHIDGTSGGIFGTAMRASGLSPRQCAARWRSLDLRGFMQLLPLRSYRSQHSLPALGSAEGVRKKIFPALGVDIGRINSNDAFDATFNVCNFSTKCVESIHHREVTEDHLVAGISLPVFMPAVAIKGTWYTDAVWIKDANITGAVMRGAGEIWVAWCIGNTPDYLNGFFNQYVHMIEMSANAGLINELEWVREQNRLRLAEHEAPVVVHLVEPEYPLPLDPDFFLKRIDADTLINMGYADTRMYLDNPQPLRLEAIEQAIIMKAPGICLHFRQQFAGSLQLGGTLQRLTLRLAFFVHETGAAMVWRLYSSVDAGEGVISSGYDNAVSTGKGSIIASFRFVFADTEIVAEARLELNSSIDFLLGLDVKHATVAFVEDDVRRQAVFYQPAVNRLQNAFHLNINSRKGWAGKIRDKRRILDSVFN